MNIIYIQLFLLVVLGSAIKTIWDSNKDPKTITDEKFLLLSIEDKLLDFFEDKKIKNIRLTKPKIINIELLSYGFKALIDIKGICSYKDIEKHIDFLTTLFSATEVNLKVIEGDLELEVVNVPYAEETLSELKSDGFNLAVGYNHKGHLLVDMKKYPHLFIAGLTNSGKSYMLKSIFKGLSNKAILFGIQSQKNDLHKFIDDVACTNSEIVELLKRIDNIFERRIKVELDYKPIYLVIEEIAFLYNGITKQEKEEQKEIQYYLTKFIKLSRAVNIFLIATTQKATLDNCSIKDMFNARICMRQIEDQGYKNVLGFIPEDTTLKQREFYLISDILHRGITYTYIT